MAGCVVVLVPWWHAPQTDWYGVLGRFPLSVRVLSIATARTLASAERASWSVLAALVTRVDGAHQLACARGRWCNGADAMVLRGQKWTGDIVADTLGSPGIIASVAGEPTGLLATTPAMRPDGCSIGRHPLGQIAWLIAWLIAWDMAD